MVSHLYLGDTEATSLRNHRNKTVEIAIELQLGIFNHLTAISFKATVNIVQMDTGHFTYRSVENARWECLGERIKARKFPASDQIIAFIEFLKIAWDLQWIILRNSMKAM